MKNFLQSATQPPVDHYAILGLPCTATPEQIRNSFRRLAKQHHPDRNPRNPHRAAEKLRGILAAYETLRDAARRSDYDQLMATIQEEGRDYRREFLLAHKTQPEEWARLVLHELMQGNDLEAQAAYDEGRARGPKFDLALVLPERDWVDCKFLLAESYERYRRPEAALALYEEVFFAPGRRERRQFIREEVRDRIRNLCVRKLAREAAPGAAIGYYERALRLNLPRAERAHLHKKIAECRLSLGEADAARRSLAEAFAIKPNLAGARKIAERLGMDVPVPA